MSDETVHAHCWHEDAGSDAPAVPREEVCCHCGARRMMRLRQVPIPEGHGPYYPRESTWTSVPGAVTPNPAGVEARPVPPHGRPT